MIDIISADENGMGVYNTQTQRAKNILSVQLGSLMYAPKIGVDLAYFLREDITFENEGFKAYLIQVLASQSINVASVDQVIHSLYESYTFNLTSSENTGSLVAG